MNKPPIGAVPGWIVYESRINELTEAISRYTEYVGQCKSVESNEYIAKCYSLISTWAAEIESIGKLMASLERRERQ